VSKSACHVLLVLGLLTSVMTAAARTDDPVDQLYIDAIASWQGDLEGMIERRMVRVLVPYSRSLYFLDSATPRGIAFEIMTGFEKALKIRSSTEVRGESRSRDR
jgi:hypothetical protein